METSAEVEGRIIFHRKNMFEEGIFGDIEGCMAKRMENSIFFSIFGYSQMKKKDHTRIMIRLNGENWEIKYLNGPIEF